MPNLWLHLRLFRKRLLLLLLLLLLLCRWRLPNLCRWRCLGWLPDLWPRRRLVLLWWRWLCR